jgi:calcium-dependent protein kinase
MHRDIKADNIQFLDKEMTQPVLLDLGLASFIQGYKGHLSRCGTPGYVAPEVANMIDKTKTYN